MLDTILTPRVLAVVGVVCLALMAFAAGWAFFKVCYQKALGRPVPRNWFTNGCDVLAEIGNNIPGAINRALKLAGKPGLFLPTQPADGSAPTASAATIDVLSTENAALRDALAALQRRVGDSRVVTQPMGAPTAQANGSRAGSPPSLDPTQRQTIAPGVAHPAQMFGPSFDPSLTQDVTDAARVVRSVVAESAANDPSTPTR